MALPVGGGSPLTFGPNEGHRAFPNVMTKYKLPSDRIILFAIGMLVLMSLNSCASIGHNASFQDGVARIDITRNVGIRAYYLHFSIENDLNYSVTEKCRILAKNNSPLKVRIFGRRRQPEIGELTNLHLAPGDSRELYAGGLRDFVENWKFISVDSRESGRANIQILIEKVPPGECAKSIRYRVERYPYAWF